jgi:hypothetical protein
MEFNPSSSLILPDSLGLIGNDSDDEDRSEIVREQKNQNEVKQ